MRKARARSFNEEKNAFDNKVRQAGEQHNKKDTKMAKNKDFGRFKTSRRTSTNSGRDDTKMRTGMDRIEWPEKQFFCYIKYGEGMITTDFWCSSCNDSRPLNSRSKPQQAETSQSPRTSHLISFFVNFVRLFHRFVLSVFPAEWIQFRCP